MNKLTLSNLTLSILLIIISTSLILTHGNNYLYNSNSEYIVKINNEKISQKEFLSRCNFEFERAKKKNIIKNKQKFISNIYKKTLFNIINETLLRQYTKRLNFKINNSSVKNYIYNQAIFQKKYTFNLEKYYQYLKSLKITSNEYIQKITTYLEINKLFETIINTDFIFPNEINKILKQFSHKRMVQKSYINDKVLENIKNIINKEKQQSYYVKNKKHISQKKENTRKFLKKQTIKQIPKTIVQKIIYKLNSKANNLSNKLQLKFENPKFYSRLNTNEFTKKIFSLPIPKTGQNIYFSFYNQKQAFICKLLKDSYYNLTQQEKKIIVRKILINHAEMILNSILDNLNKTAKISYKPFLSRNTI